MRKTLLLLTLSVCSKNLHAQNVGIGTAAPAAKLHVKGTGGGTQIVLEENAGSILRISNEPSGTGPYIGTTSNHPLSIVTNNSVKLSLTTSGNLGIGQAAPTSPLHFANTLGNKIALWGIGADHYGIGIQPFQMQFFTPASTDDFVFGIGNSSSLTENMRLKGNGNLGIGLTNPTSKLELRGGGLGISSSNKKWEINYDSTGNYFYIDELGVQRRLYIKNGGNVGIGTADPQEKLSIAGGVIIDHNNQNFGSAANILRFGNTGAEGIGSKRNGGTNQYGLDFYTQGNNRMTITKDGLMGINTKTPKSRLTVYHQSEPDVRGHPSEQHAIAIWDSSYNYGTAALFMGVNNISNRAYITFNNEAYSNPANQPKLFINPMGNTTFIGGGWGAANSPHKLVVANGSALVEGDFFVNYDIQVNGSLTANGNASIQGPLTVAANTAVQGLLTVQGSVTVEGNKGIIRNTSSTQLKQVVTPVQVSHILIPQNGGFVTQNVSWAESFSGTPTAAFVGNITFGVGFQIFTLHISNVTSTGCTLSITNTSEVPAGCLFYVNLITTGPQ
jgi:hypothetical protein